MKQTLKEKSLQNIGSTPKRQQLFYIYRLIMNRRNFEYSLKHLFKYFCLCRSLRRNDKLRQGPAKRDLYLNRAIVKLKKDMSIVKLLNRAQIVEEMHQILFNKSDRMLMEMQKRRVVSSNSSVSDES